MAKRKIPENEIHQISVNLAKNIRTSAKPWEYEKIIEDFTISPVIMRNALTV